MSNPIHTGRATYRFKDNPLEHKFAMAWSKQNEKLWDGTLGYLMGDGNRPGPIDGRDALVAATVVQWLGSHVGQCFLAEVLSTPQAEDVRERIARAIEDRKNEDIVEVRPRKKKKLEPSEDID